MYINIFLNAPIPVSRFISVISIISLLMIQSTGSVLAATASNQPITNLALNQVSSQSSTGWGGVSSRAVDGIMDGDYYSANSVTHTLKDNDSWWQVDLGARSSINQIKVWHRAGGCCPSRMTDFYVFVSDTPFTSTTLAQTLSQPGVSQYHITETGSSSAPTLIDIGKSGRYVRIQLPGTRFLSLAEVQVMGSNTSLDFNLALNKTSNQSSTGWGGVSSRAVDGNTNGDYYSASSVTHTLKDNNAWWQVDLGALSSVNQIKVWHRAGGCCPNRMTDFYVFVSDTPFTSTTLAQTLSQPGVSQYHITETGSSSTPTLINIGKSARYVRIQLPGTRFLSLAEVQVIGTINLVSTNQATSQSSTGWGGDSSRAVDGNTDGKYTSNSVTHTGLQANAWWQIDLGKLSVIDAIKLWNRTDCCSERLANFYVFVSDTPFTSNDLAQTRAQPGISEFFTAGAIGQSALINIGRPGRYVRIQLAGTNYLSLAEVQVFGQPPVLPSWLSHNWMINNHAAIIDELDKKIFITLDEGYDQATDYTMHIDFDPAFNFKIAGNTVQPNSSITLNNIHYGSEVIVERYQNNSYIDEAILIFTQLPVIYLSADTIIDDPKSEGIFQLMSGVNTESTAPLTMGIEIRGASSQAYPKKSFDFELAEDFDWQTGKNFRLLNMRKDDDWIMDAAYRDTTFARNKISHDLFLGMQSKTPSNGQSTIGSRFVEVVLNDKYHGIYILSEQIDRKLLKLAKVNVPTDAAGIDLWDQVDYSLPENGSVLYKSFSHKGNFYDKANRHEGYRQKYPKVTDSVRWQPVDDLVNFVANSDRATFVAEVNNRINVDNIVDYWVLILAIQGKDNADKNYYLGRNEHDQFFFAPWDMDTSFGMWWTGARDDTTNWYPINDNNLIRRLSLYPETGFNNKVQARWNELRQSLLSSQALVSQFQNHLDLAFNSNADLRTFTRWPGSGGNGVNNPELNTITYIQTWIDQRLAFVDDKMTTLSLHPNTDPTAIDDVFSTSKDAHNIDLAVLDDNGNGVDFDADNHNFVVDTVDTPTQGGTVSINNAENGLIYSPAAGFIGVETFSYTIKDSFAGQATATVSVTVTDSTVQNVALVINEIHYNPTEGNGHEFIELVNSGNSDVDLSGFNFSSGVTYTFPAGSSISAGETIIMANDAASYSGNGYTVYQWDSGKLSNGGETIELQSSTGAQIDIVDYADQAPWPTEADGGGYSLELINLTLDNADATNWQASNILGGTPGV